MLARFFTGHGTQEGDTLPDPIDLKWEHPLAEGIHVIESNAHIDTKNLVKYDLVVEVKRYYRSQEDNSLIPEDEFDN